MNGVLCVDKPQDFTSFDVIAKMRGILQIRKIGHAGTLDPMATGVLPLLIGNATRACDVLPVEDKRYTAEFLLGKTTDTQDITGTVLQERECRVGRKPLEKALEAFRGQIVQIPPMYSAVQVNGTRLYDLARQGKEVEREPRNVFIASLELLEYDEASARGVLDIRCSKGTYIRTICHDLGQALGVGCVLASLRRTESAGFGLERCVTLEQVQQLKNKGADMEPYIIPLGELFASYPQLKLNKVQSRMFSNGVRLDLGRTAWKGQSGYHSVYAEDGAFLGLALPDREAMELNIAKVFR